MFSDPRAVGQLARGHQMRAGTGFVLSGEGAQQGLSLPLECSAQQRDEVVFREPTDGGHANGIPEAKECLAITKSLQIEVPRSHEARVLQGSHPSDLDSPATCLHYGLL